jgi:amino acid transporter
MDLRVPIGGLFTIFGLILTVFGLFTDPSMYYKSLGINVNLEWGFVMLAFGASMLIFAYFGRAAYQETAEASIDTNTD